MLVFIYNRTTNILSSKSGEAFMNEISVQGVIDKINSVYRQWNKHTSLSQMRQDWDDLFQPAGTLAIGSDVTMRDFAVAGIPCRWTQPRDPNHDVILYVHGGGFRLGSMNSHQKLVSALAKTSRCRVLSFDYRLMPEHIFPSQLDDTSKVYQWLLEEGTPANNIIMVGDSAGANLAAALIQRLKQHPKPHQQKLPRAMVLISPWLDMTLAGDSYTSRANLDPVHQKHMLNALATEYLGNSVDRQSALASPLFGDLTELPPTLIHFGGREIGLDDGVAYQRKAEAAGSEVTLDIWPEMIHVFHLFVDELPEATAAIKQIGDFINNTRRR